MSIGAIGIAERRRRTVAPKSVLANGRIDLTKCLSSPSNTTQARPGQSVFSRSSHPSLPHTATHSVAVICIMWVPSEVPHVVARFSY